MDKGKNRKNKRKFITKGHGNEPTVIEFNLSKAVILCIAIGVIIATITTIMKEQKTDKVKYLKSRLFKRFLGSRNVSKVCSLIFCIIYIFVFPKSIFFISSIL